VLPLNVAKWPAVFSAKTCPHCEFKPQYDPRLIEPRTKLGRVAVPGLYIAACAAAVFFLIAPLRQPNLPSIDAIPKREVPLDWTMQTLDGRSIEAASLRGKVIFLNVCHSKNRRSRWEMASINQLHRRLGNDVVIAAVSNEPVETLQQFVSEQNLNVPLYRVEDGPPELFEDHRVPRTYIIDAAGGLRFKNRGARDWANEETVDYLRALAAGAGVHGLAPDSVAGRSR
jgi:hypothetical protein